MITNKPIRFLCSRDCPYTLRGQNLATLRRARLRPIAIALGLEGEGSKNELLHRLIARLKAANADKELDKHWDPDGSDAA